MRVRLLLHCEPVWVWKLQNKSRLFFERFDGKSNRGRAKESVGPQGYLAVFGIFAGGGEGRGAVFFIWRGGNRCRGSPAPPSDGMVDDPFPNSLRGWLIVKSSEVIRLFFGKRFDGKWPNLNQTRHFRWFERALFDLAPGSSRNSCIKLV
jgi:hypothetical protein